MVGIFMVQNTLVAVVAGMLKCELEQSKINLPSIQGVNQLKLSSCLHSGKGKEEEWLCFQLGAASQTPTC